MQIVVNIPEETLLQGIKEALLPYLERGGFLNQSPPPVINELVSYTKFQAMLIDKGYKAKSYQTVMKAAEDNNVGYTKKGRDLWFKYAEAILIPSKI